MTQGGVCMERIVGLHFFLQHNPVHEKQSASIAALESQIASIQGETNDELGPARSKQLLEKLSSCVSVP